MHLPEYVEIQQFIPTKLLFVFWYNEFIYRITERSIFMQHIKQLFAHEAVRLPLECLAAFSAGYLLSVGTICGIVSPLAAALAGICTPLYAFFILCGSLLAYIVQGAPSEMTFLLACLVSVSCMRILFYEARRPHVLAILTVISCSAAGVVNDLVFSAQGGLMPLYLLAAMLIGLAAFFLSDAWNAYAANRRILLDTGKSFTFSIVYLLAIAALCGLDLPFCNPGRIAGIFITLLAARQFRQGGGTLLGALSACAAVLCNVKLGMPLLFLPVTAMLAGFLSHLPNAIFIPVFFLMQTLGSIVFDSSMELVKVLLELVISCFLYALCSRAPLYRILMFHSEKPVNGQCVMQREQFLSHSIGDLREEAAEIMQRLRPEKNVDAVAHAKERLCTGCKNENYCWQDRRDMTEDAFRQLLHFPAANPGPEAMAGCVRRGTMAECFRECGRNIALEKSRCVHLSQSRNVMLEYFHLMEEMTTDSARQREVQLCVQETEGLQEILRHCKCEFRSCFVHRLKSGRYAAEIYTSSPLAAEGAVLPLLQELLHVEMCAGVTHRNADAMRYCFYQKPPYSLEFSIRSIHAPGYSRCGDTADAFTDAEGNQYLLLSDGMGSGASASLVSKLAVRAFTRLVCSGMPCATAIRFVNAMLLSETSNEDFATLDVLFLNADSGELQLYKSGASSTLFLHGGQVMKISSPSFPIGIVPQAEPFRKTLSSFAGDRIVMLSDGIHEAEFPFVKELLLRCVPLGEMITQICEKAGIFHAGKADDDITVIAARVLCESQNPSAIPQDSLQAAAS